MCRSIKVLRKPEQPATAEEISAAALQFVRKISGFHKPSKANEQAFYEAVREISEASSRLLKTIAASSPKATATKVRTIAALEGVLGEQSGGADVSVVLPHS